MSDFPTTLSNTGAEGILAAADLTPLGDIFMIVGGGYVTATGVWTANRAVYQPVYVPRPITVTDAIINVVTQAGNVDAGLYTWGGTLIVANGGVACGAAGAQVIPITDTPLTAGWYQLGFASNSSTAIFRNNGLSAPNIRMCGVRDQATAYPLPSPSATFAVPTLAVTPLVELGYRSVV